MVLDALMCLLFDCFVRWSVDCGYVGLGGVDVYWHSKQSPRLFVDLTRLITRVNWDRILPTFGDYYDLWGRMVRYFGTVLLYIAKSLSSLGLATIAETEKPSNY